MSVTKPKIFQDIAVYNIGADINQDTVKIFLDNLERHRPILRGLGVRAVTFSLEEVQKFDKDAFLKIIDRFDLLQREIKVPTAITGYSERQFGVLKMLLKDTSIALFKNIQIAALAAGTSRVRKSSAILVYSEDNDEKNMVSSELISNGYFIILANNFNDFKKKFERKGSYSLVVVQSRFGGMRDEVMTLFNNGIYYYTARGLIDETMYSRFDFEAHKKRMEMGYKAFVFDLSNMATMDVKGAHFFLKLTEDSTRYGAIFSMVGIDHSNVFSNAMIVLEKCHVWSYDSLDDIFEDEEFIQLVKSRKIPHHDFKPTKEIAQKIPFFANTMIETIKTYGKWDIEKSSPAVLTLDKVRQKDVIIENFISFDGDLAGSMVFLFPKATAKMLSAAMTGIEGDDLEDKDYLDVMSEFVNSVTGKIKTSIVKVKTYISFSLPHPHLSSEGYLNKYKQLPGIVMEFKLDGNPIYLFICGGRLS